MQNHGFQIISKYFPELNSEQMAKFEALEGIYAAWNARINLISRKDFANFYTHHVLHSLAIAHYLSFPAGSQVLDVGSGGGFPGIPLSIFFQDVQFTMLDSIQKKVNVIHEVSKEIDLQNVTPVCRRIEDFDGQFHFITARAVTRFDEFVKIVRKNLLKTNALSVQLAIIYLKGGELESEIRSFGNSIRIFDISEIFSEDFFQTKRLLYLPF